MNIEFYFDPSCPFCWITSRWIHVVSGQRDINITWLPFSLALKNNLLTPSDNENSHAESARASHRLLRVMMQASENHGADLGKLYTTAGIRFHVAGFPYDMEAIEQLLADENLPSELIGAADDETLDASIQNQMDQVLKIAGNDIGVPAIVFLNQDGSRQGYFGPVLNELPSAQESLDLWDGLSKLATSKSFYELKRTRPSGDPDVFSTAHC